MSQESEIEDRAHSFHPAPPREAARHAEYHTLCNKRFPNQSLKKPQFASILLRRCLEETTPKRNPTVKGYSKIGHPVILLLLLLILMESIHFHGVLSPLAASQISHLNQLALVNCMLSTRHGVSSSIHSIFIALGSNKEASRRLRDTGIPSRQTQAPKCTCHCQEFTLPLRTDA